jgi:hypothetical protein
VPDTKTTPSHVTGATPTGPSSPVSVLIMKCY